MNAKSICAAASAMVLLLGGCSSPTSGADPDGEPVGAVAVRMFMFSPSPLSVKVGQDVTWTNHDEILHTATSGAPGSPDGVFDGTMDGQGRSFRFTFDRKGTYPYFCDRHNGMAAEVDVSERT